VIRKKLDLRLHTMGLSPLVIDEELLDLMKNAGFNEADIGAESACDEILESLAKDFKRADIENAAKLLRQKKIAVTWFIILGAPAETRETVNETLYTIARIASKWDLVFISTGIRAYNGAPVSNELMKQDFLCTEDNFLRPVKIEPSKISLEEIQAIAKSFSFRFPNFYFYEKEHIIPGRILIIGNFLLRIFRSSQPVWRLLIFLKMTERVLGLTLIKKYLYELKKNTRHEENQIPNGFSIISSDKSN
jgi:radical SAM superfamily enzyme YgiQ (UPF0313 family)